MRTISFSRWRMRHPLPSLLSFPFFISRGFGWGWEGQIGLRNELPQHSTGRRPPVTQALPPSTHTWDGHFISECSKWKGDLNLACFPPTASALSISHTQSRQTDRQPALCRSLQPHCLLGREFTSNRAQKKKLSLF